MHPGRALDQAVGGQQLPQALLPGEIFREGQAKGPGRGLQAVQVLFQEMQPPILGPQGLEQAVPVEKTPVVDRHPGLGNRDQVVIEPDKRFSMRQPFQGQKLGAKGEKAKRLTKESCLIIRQLLD